MSEVLYSELEFSYRIDSEYYRPSLIKYQNMIQCKGGKELKNFSDFLIGPFGSSFTVDNYVDNPDYRYIRGKDVKPLRLQDNDNVYMPKSDYIRLERYALKENDILVTVVGTLGNAALVTKKDLPAIFSCKSTVIRTHSINPVYLLVYINCKYGQELLNRKERGAVQKGFNLGDLETLDIFEPSVMFQEKIEGFFRKSLQYIDKSKNLYTQAEELLLAEVGLQDFSPSTEKINIKSFADSFGTSGRLDAEYYQPKYEQVISKIERQNYDSLKNIVSIKKSIEPGSKNYADEGLPFLRVADFSKQGLTEPQKYLTTNFIQDNKKTIGSLKPKKNNILFSKDGSVGMAYQLREDFNGITSGAILHLKVKDNEKLLPEYLTLVLNSELVQLQAQREAGGSIILHWRVSEIEEVIVPIIALEKQQQIAALVEQSFALRAQSEHLLEIAKRAVEIAIEEGEATAMVYIKKEAAYYE